MDFGINNLGPCGPAQILNYDYAINDISKITIISQCGCPYSKEELQVSYSCDGVNWTCFTSYDEAMEILIEMDADYYVRYKFQGGVQGITVENPETGEQEPSTDYTTQIADGFQLNTTNCSKNTNVYNPYANLDGALSLQQQLTDTVSCMIGIPIYYFKLTPNTGSRDLTFKEYALMDVEAVKQIKLIINDGQMPSSKPEFSDFGMDWATDWETEISKSMFSTAFGPTAKPMEGDLIYIPMMKRMWMVNESYEEKNGSLMWNATTFKVMLVKYQEKGSVDLGDTQTLVDSFVKNKYDDLFGDQENLDSGFESTDSPHNAADNLYPVFESDATRKYVTVEGIDFVNTNLYYKATLISDNCYRFLRQDSMTKIIYQRQYCGDEGSVSFIINPMPGVYEGVILNIANIKIKIKQTKAGCSLSVVNNQPSILKLNVNEHYFVWLRWSKKLNNIEFGAAKYSYPDNIPLYKLQNSHYYFEMDRPIAHKVTKYNIEMTQEKKGDIWLQSFIGMITNIKVFDIYNDDLGELLQQYPTNQHLLVNDAARKLIDMHGVSLR